MKPDDIPQDVWCIVLSAANSEDMEVAMSDAILAAEKRGEERMRLACARYIEECNDPGDQRKAEALRQLLLLNRT
jgi:hypothetical protein